MANEKRRKVGSFGGKKFKNLQRDRQDDNGLIQSIPVAPRPPPPPALEGKFPGVGTLELSNPRDGGGGGKRANAPTSVNTATFFIERTVE